MNIRRGLFRLWIVLSALFVLLMAFLSYAEVRGEFERSTPEGDWFDRFALLPTECTVESRGAKGGDYEEDGGLCWYRMRSSEFSTRSTGTWEIER